ncbi:Enhancer of polycomb-like protein 1 [Malassezia equina]|uniref:Enhancer of polycomb-like protein n=1 Tax=Malassezia equina TaxID=1381935 RepID=A0AAF0EDL6_9BASI|nr:Enhancer of polycomb-like protein 1 [Malassezia equina]
MTDDEDALLAASRKAYQEKVNHKKSGNWNQEVFTNGTDIIQFEDDEDDTYRNDLKSSKPVKETSAKKRGKQREILKKDVTDSALHALEVTPVTTTRKPSKREVEEFHAKSAGPKWFGMPAFGGASYKSSSKKAQTDGGKSSFTGGDARAATEKELRQQIQAIRLRNALDPKRFYRGGSGTGAERGIPAFAQLGRIVGGGLEPSSVLTRSQRSDTVVGELVRDSQSVSYSKRKFEERGAFLNGASNALVSGITPEFESNDNQQDSTFGVDSHEITEHHLQAALSSNQVGTSGGSGAPKKSYHIPTPKSVEVLSQAQYNKEYPPGAYSDPVTYVRYSDTVESTTQGPPYCMDDDDKGWLDKHNERARKELQKAEKDSKTAENVQYKALVKKDAAKYTIISEDEFETVMFVFEHATCERHPLLELDMSKMPTLDDLLREFDEKSATSAMALPELPKMDASIAALVSGSSNKSANSKSSTHVSNAEKGKSSEEELQWFVQNPFRHLFLLKPCARAIYPWWKLRREAREGKQIVPQLNFDESNENDPYVCFRRREVKSARKTRKTDNLQLEKLVRLESEMRQATALMLMVAQRERFKEQQVVKARSCWTQAQELMALKSKWAILGPNKGHDDENLIFSIQPDPTAPVAVTATTQHAQLKKKRKADESSTSTTLKIRRPKAGEADQAVSKSSADTMPNVSNSAILDRIHAVQTFIEPRVAPMLLPTPDLSWDPLTSKDPRAPLSRDPSIQFGRLDEHSGTFNVTQNSDGASTSSESTDRTRSSEESGDGQSTQATDIDQDAMQEDKLQQEPVMESMPEESVEEQMERAQKLAERWRYDEDGGRWAGLGLLGLGGMEGDEEAVLDDFDQRFIRYRMSLLDESNLLKLSTDWTYMRQALMAAAVSHTPTPSTVTAPANEANGNKSERDGATGSKSKNSGSSTVPAKTETSNQAKEAN